MKSEGKHSYIPVRSVWPCECLIAQLCSAKGNKTLIKPDISHLYDLLWERCISQMRKFT